MLTIGVRLAVIRLKSIRSLTLKTIIIIVQGYDIANEILKHNIKILYC